MGEPANTRLLKLGVTRAETFLFQSYFIAPSMVTVGRHRSATLWLNHRDVPREMPLFSLGLDSCLLQFRRGLDLAFLYDGLFRDPNYLIDEGLAFRRGRDYYLNLATRARGTLNFGPFRILFKLDLSEPPPVQVMQLPARPDAVSRCAFCDHELKLVLPKPGVMTRCSACRKFSRFEGLTGPISKIVEPPAASTFEESDEDMPVLLDQPVDGPPRHTSASLEDALTVLDAGVIREPDAATGEGTALGPGTADEAPEPASLPDRIEERDTAQHERPMFQGSTPSAPPPPVPGGSPAPGPVTPPAGERRTASGDRLRVVPNGNSGVSATADADDAAEATFFEREGDEDVEAAPIARVGGTSANVVPLPLAARRRPGAALSSAPYNALAEPDPEPLSRSARSDGLVSDSYAAAKLADRLTWLIVALVMIALLLACILGVLLTHTAMRRWTADPPAEVERSGERPAGAADGADADDGDV